MYDSNKSTLLLNAEKSPKATAQHLLKVLREKKAHRGKTAEELGVTFATFTKVVNLLGIQSQLDALTLEAKNKGWHHGRTGGRPTASQVKAKTPAKGAKRAKPAAKKGAKRASAKRG